MTRTVTANMVYIIALGGGIGVGLLFIRRSCAFSIQRDVYTVQALTWSGAGALKGAIGAFRITWVMFALIFVLVFYSYGAISLATDATTLACAADSDATSLVRFAAAAATPWRRSVPVFRGRQLPWRLTRQILRDHALADYGITSGIGNAARVAVAMIINATVFTAVASWYVPAWSPFIPLVGCSPYFPPCGMERRILYIMAS